MDMKEKHGMTILFISGQKRMIYIHDKKEKIKCIGMPDGYNNNEYGYKMLNKIDKHNKIVNSSYIQERDCIQNR
jgi:hypothetical protein